MSDPFLQRLVVPVANCSDAEQTVAALQPYVENNRCTVIAVHVLEKRKGPDKASVEQRELAARDIFSTLRTGLEDSDITLVTELLYGSDIPGTIIEAAHDLDASAILFTPRGGSRWKKLLTGDITNHLLENSDLPVLVLPQPEVTES